MKSGRAFLCLIVGAVACGRGLPSSTSLGGKLDDEALQAPEVDRRAEADTEDAVDAGEEQGDEQGDELSAIVDAGPPPDAAVEEKAEPTDSGAPVTPSAGAVAKWAGEYVGSDLTTTRFEGLPERVQPDDKARTRVEEPKPGQVVLIVVDSSNGNPLCSLNADATGGTASIHADQSCFESEGMTATVVEGDARLEGDRLVFDLQIAVEVDAGDVAMSGEIAYHFDGKRR